MRDSRGVTCSRIRSVWEALFSLHTGLAGTAIAFTAFGMDPCLFRMETSIKVLLHLRQTDLVEGYIASWIPAGFLALVVWLVLRATRRLCACQRFLRSTSGIVTLIVPLVAMAVSYLAAPQPMGWLYVVAPLEMAAVLAIVLRILSGKWRIPTLATLLLLALHYIFWYFALGAGPFRLVYVGPAGQVLGFVSSAAWSLFLGCLERTRAE